MGATHRCFVTSMDSLSHSAAGGPGLSAPGEGGKPWRWPEGWPHASPAPLLRDSLGEVLGQVSHCPPLCPFQTFWGACVTDSIIEMDGMSLQ